MATSITRLRHARDIRSVFATGAVAHGRALVVHARRREDKGATRWTVVAGRKVGAAVQRNRAKRRLRAAVRSSVLPQGLDMVVVARPAAVRAAFGALRAEFEALLGRVVAATSPATAQPGRPEPPEHERPLQGVDA